jgi:hypothetical protein
LGVHYKSSSSESSSESRRVRPGLIDSGLVGRNDFF